MIKHLLVVAALLPLAGHAAAADLPEMRPYLTAHTISLAPGDNGDVVSIDGLKTVSWHPNCDGAAMNHRISMTIQFNDGPPVLAEDTSSTWESSDGQTLCFLTASKSSEGSFKAIEGTASREGGQVVVRYTAPEK